MKLKLQFIKITRFEFWPYWIFYLPVVPYFLWLMIKSRSAAFFTNVNPGIYLSGIVGESKEEILKHISEKYKAKSVLISKDNTDDAENIIQLHFQFPIIVKPNIGERGNGVEKVNSIEEFRNIKNTYKDDFIIQEFIDYEYEFGVMYYHIPNTNEYGVTSIVQKGFLKVIGDGHSSLKQLLSLNFRAQLVWDYLEEQLNDRWDEIPAKGEVIYPQPIGNHCKGTMFINGNHLINKSVSNLFHSIAQNFNGFYYGRFDVKVKSLKDLETGENLRIMELNGLTSEPAHIYDPKMSLWKAYKTIINHFRIVYRISKANSKLGVKPSSWNEFSRLMKAYYQQ